MTTPVMHADYENKVFTFDHSTQAVACDRKLYWSEVKKIKKLKTAVPLHFGKALHKFVEHFWLKHPGQECIQEYLKVVRSENSPIVDDIESDENRTVQRGLDVCIWYAEHYAAQRQETEIVVINGVPLVEVSFAIPIGVDEDGWTYMYAGRLDRVEKYRNDIRLVDTKSTSRMGKSFWNMLRPNDQFTGYWKGIMDFTGIKPDRFIVDCIYVGEPRKANENGKFSVPGAVKKMGDVAVEQWMKNVSFEQGPTRRSDADLQRWQVNTFQEGLRLRNLWMTPGYMPCWTMRTSQCNIFGECPYRDLCNLTDNIQPVIDALYTHDDWSPFKKDDESDG